MAWPPFPILMADAFSRNNENPISLSGRWSAITGLGKMKLSNDAAECASAATPCGMVYTGQTCLADQLSSVNVGAMTTTGSFAYVFVRVTGNTYYQLSIAGADGASGTQTLYSVVGGVKTSIGTFTATPADIDNWTLLVVGTTLTVYQNLTQMLQVTDSTIASGQPGMGGLSSSGTSKVMLFGFAAGCTYTGPVPILTPLFSDTCQRANEAPINPANWTSVGVSGPGQLPTYDEIDIQNDQATTTVQVQADGQISYNGALPNDQFISYQINAWKTGGSAAGQYVRSNPWLEANYNIIIAAPNPAGYPYPILTCSTNNLAGDGTNWDFLTIYPLNISVGDVFAFAIIGTALNGGNIYAFQNGRIIFVAPLALNVAIDGTVNQPYSGMACIQLNDEEDSPTEGVTGIINILIGSATLPGSGGGGGHYTTPPAAAKLGQRSLPLPIRGVMPYAPVTRPKSFVR